MTEQQNPPPADEQAADEIARQIRPSRYEMRPGPYSSRFINIERRVAGDRAFPSDDDVFYASTPRPTHWSIAWSDLMMTMFVLFLCMFVYKAANEEFLGGQNPEVIGGDTTDALQTTDAGNVGFPFDPIYHGAPLMTTGTIRKVEPAPGRAKPEPDREMLDEPAGAKGSQQLAEETEDSTTGKPREKTGAFDAISPPLAVEPPQVAIITTPEEHDTPPITVSKIPPQEDEVQPRPLIAETPESSPQEPQVQQDIYRLSKDAVESGGLEKFASIDLVPDQTMRIILTSDLLFDLGQSWLSEKAQQSLLKIGEIISQTPYMINVVGHTDNIPMASNRFASNWELSVARASTVARFLIDELDMNPNQFVVSGYSSYRPMVPNTTAENRARNRRVEIIVSKKLPPPQQATLENLN